MSDSLLTTKLYFPPARANLVPRPRLIERLKTGLQGPLTLISAPAGSGKTTLMSAWRTGPGHNVPTAWLSLDVLDNDPARFLLYLTAALGTVTPGLAASTALLLHSSELPSLDTIQVSFIQELNAFTSDLVVALDDYHVIANPEIHAILDFLLSHLPPSTHLVILTRSDPPLPIARLRVRNQLVEIRAEHLRFTAPETAAFLHGMGAYQLTEPQLAALEGRTEGWIAGLQLAALSMQGLDDIGNFISTFTGSHHYIVDYLVNEVLDRQPEPVRIFLMQTSILARLDVSLCNAVTGRTDSREMLKSLEQANLFLIPLDNERRWYRYHHLFADVLHSYLGQTQPEHIPALHHRAAEWFENNGFLEDAISHALAGGDKERAGRLAELNNSRQLMRGELVALSGMLKRVEELIPERPWLCIDKAWMLMLTGQPQDVESFLQQAERLISTRSEDSATQLMRGNITAIRCYMAVRNGDASLCFELCQKAIEILSENDPGVLGVVYLARGGANILRGNFPAAIQSLLEASRLGMLARNVSVAVTATSTVANLWMSQGQLHQSEKVYRETLPLALQPDGQVLPSAARVYSGLSRLYYEWNDLDTAQEYAQIAFDFGQKWGNTDTLVSAHVLLARLKQARRDEHGAEESMRAAEALMQTRQLTPTGPGWVEMSRVWLWLAQGNLDACDRWVRAHGSISINKPAVDEGERLILACILLAQGDHTSALEFFAQLLLENEPAGHWGTVIELLVFQAIAFQQKGEISTALKTLARALTLAEPEGYTRVFLDQGTPVKELLRKMKDESGRMKTYIHRLLAGFDAFSASPPQPLIDPLSARELEVLRLLAAGKSNRQIASELVVAIGTVKRHINNIFGKLDAGSRTQCVARARELHLL